uniref:Uncharacterized protein n=1 Tax=Arundo donax TaxID=35708 RepID=A0A0A9AAS5_ARUDO
MRRWRWTTLLLGPTIRL